MGKHSAVSAVWALFVMRVNGIFTSESLTAVIVVTITVAVDNDAAARTRRQRDHIPYLRPLGGRRERRASRPPQGRLNKQSSSGPETHGSLSVRWVLRGRWD